jgi:hypothetical protein
VGLLFFESRLIVCNESFFSLQFYKTYDIKEQPMKLKMFVLLLITVLLLSACGEKKLDKSITLLNQNSEEISFPLEKPALFFFITSYT